MSNADADDGDAEDDGAAAAGDATSAAADADAREAAAGLTNHSNTGTPNAEKPAASHQKTR